MISDNGLYADPTPVTNPSTAYDLYPRVYLEVFTFIYNLHVIHTNDPFRTSCTEDTMEPILPS